MTVRDALIEFMKQKGFNALVNTSCGCGCDLDDFAPCDSIADCELGYSVPSDCDNCKNEECESRGEPKCIRLEKQEQETKPILINCPPLCNTCFHIHRIDEPCVNNNPSRLKGRCDAMLDALMDN